jgi:hypothetical protein
VVAFLHRLSYPGSAKRGRQCPRRLASPLSSDSSDGYASRMRIPQRSAARGVGVRLCTGRAVSQLAAFMANLGAKWAQKPACLGTNRGTAGE